MASGQCIGSSLAVSILFYFSGRTRKPTIGRALHPRMESLQYILLSSWCSLPVGIICSAVDTAFTVSVLPAIKIPIQHSNLCVFISFILSGFINISYLWVVDRLAWLSMYTVVLGSTSQIRLHLPINLDIPRNSFNHPRVIIYAENIHKKGVHFV